MHPKVCASLITGVVFCWPLNAVQAQGFAAYVSPPRIELRVEPGKTIRQIIEITSANSLSSSIKVYSADWQLDPQGHVTFFEALQPGSCRPWVSIERKQFRLAPAQRYRYRFEVAVPPGEGEGECRFALMFEGEEPAEVKSLGNLAVSGRIGVIVYVAVGGAKPKLSVQGSRITQLDGKTVFGLNVRNDGSAHGRLGGVVEATDSLGRTFDLVPDETAILAHQSSFVALRPPPETVRSTVAEPPLRVKGDLEWDLGHLSIDLMIRP